MRSTKFDLISCQTTLEGIDIEVPPMLLARAGGVVGVHFFRFMASMRPVMWLSAGN
jgi:hypothetical protein